MHTRLVRNNSVYLSKKDSLTVVNQLQIHLRRTISLHLVLQLRRLYRKTRQKSNCWKRTVPYLDGCTLLVKPVTETWMSFFVWKSTLATIPFRPRTAARRTKSRLAEVPATSNLASIDTSSRCRNSRWSGYCSNAGAKNIMHLLRILQYSICSICPQATGECQAC